MKTIILSIILTFTALQVNAQKTKTDKIKTSIQCEMCVERLTNKFAEEWAIRDVDFDLENQMVSIKYNSKKIDLGEIEQLISDSGYDANQTLANKNVYNNLPFCCKKKSTTPKTTCESSQGSEGKTCASSKKNGKSCSKKE